MNIRKANEFLSEAVNRLGFRLSLDEARGETLVLFIVRKGKALRSPQYVIDTVPIPYPIGDDKRNYQRIVNAAWVEFQKHKGGKFKIVSTAEPRMGTMYGGKPVGIQVFLKPPRGWTP